MSTPIIAARFPGLCALCETRWTSGAPIAPFGARSKRSGQWGHPACVAADEMGLPSAEVARRRLSDFRQATKGTASTRTIRAPSTTAIAGTCCPYSPVVDLALTDPPYGINYVSNAGAGRGTAPITNDGARISIRLYREVVRLLKAEHVLWFTRWDAWPDVWEIVGSAFPMRGLLVWDKCTPGMGDLKHWGPSYELIASLGVGQTTGGRDGSVLRYNTVPSHNRLHPTEKPVDLLRYLIGKMDPETIVDPFMGSGSTLRAAKDLGRKAIGIEMSERYCEIAAERLAQEVLVL